MKNIVSSVIECAGLVQPISTFELFRPVLQKLADAWSKLAAKAAIEPTANKAQLAIHRGFVEPNLQHDVYSQGARCPTRQRKSSGVGGRGRSAWEQA